MADLKKKGEAPLSPKERHQRDTGTGNYNRFSALVPPSPRPRLGSKRKLDPDPAMTVKTPRLDPNVVFDQLRDVEDNLVVVKSAVAAVMSAGDNVFNIADGGLGAAVHKLALAVDMLVNNQEKFLSAVVDAAGGGGTNREKKTSKLFINRTIISNPRTEDVVLGAFADTYLAHAVPDQTLDDEHVHHLHPERALNNQKGIVGNFLRLLREFNDLSEQEIREPHNNLIPLLKAGALTNISMQRDLIWPIEKFSGLSLTCSDDFFLEALSSNIKGSVISFQTWVKKLEYLKKLIIIKDLNLLKSNYQENFEQITKLECALNSLVDAEILLKVKSMKIFSSLNCEKPTPIFLGLARLSNSSVKLANIHRSDGSPFNSDPDRVEGIVSYFENIYRSPITDCTNYTGCIDNFLGDIIANHPIVKNSKLTDAEKNILDRTLVIDELDDSVDKCNVRSAPGIDGLRNVFIKKILELLSCAFIQICLALFQHWLLNPEF